MAALHKSYKFAVTRGAVLSFGIAFLTLGCTSGEPVCRPFNGAYFADLSQQDTFLGNPGELDLSARDGLVEWTISGDMIPRLVFKTQLKSCEPQKINGTFETWASGTRLLGQFEISNQQGQIVLDASDVGYSGERANLIGYVPNRPINLVRRKER